MHRPADAVTALRAAGATTFVEVGPDAALAAVADDVTVVPVQRRDRDEEHTLAVALARLHTAGTDVDWSGWPLGEGPGADLPTYPFRRTRYWPATIAAGAAPGAADPAETELWSAVERSDRDRVAEELGLDGDTVDAVLPALGSWRRRRRTRDAAAATRYRVEWPVVDVPTAPTGPETVPADADPDTLAAARRVLLDLGAVDAPDPAALLAALDDAGSRAALWVLTRGAVALDGEQGDTDQADRWARTAVAAREHPERTVVRVDLPTGTAGTADPATAVDLPRTAGPGELAIRDGRVHARRLVRVPGGAPGGSTGWVTGATVLADGTDPRVLTALAAAGARALLLTDAPGTGFDPAGTEVTVLGHGDGVPAEVTAVVHGGGPDARWTPAELDALVADHELTAFVMLGSVAGTWHVRGRADEAAAGARAAGLARARRARDLPATAVAFGPWTGSSTADVAAHLRLHGLPELEPDTALAALAAAVAGGGPEEVVADVAWERLAPTLAQGGPDGLLALLPEAALADRPGTGDDGALRARLADLPEGARAAELTEMVCAVAARVLGHDDPAAVDRDVPFRDLGVDSLTAVDLRDRLGAATGLALPASLVFDHPTPAELARHLLAELGGATVAAAAAPAPAAAAAGEPIAIVGMACRYPGGVTSPEDLWELVRDGVDATGDMPTDRGWDLDGLASVTRRGGFLHDVAGFDADFFSVSPREAVVMDPQQRIVLETCWEALERAGIDPSVLRGSDTGVFIGGGSGEYRVSADTYGQEWQTAQSASLLSGRVAYTLGLQGPTVSVDTACSSSLVSLHLAAQALRTGECTAALAGGVTVMSTPVGFVEFSTQGALSPDGRCKPFAEDADGTAWAEGAGVLVLERLSDARRLGHRVLGLVRGSAINSDGASNGLTAPSGPAQQRVITRALAAAGLAAHEVDVVETHGTGTRLGDPIEAQALLATYGREREHPLLLGAVKSHLGHTQAASGVAGVIATVMAMQHGTVPGSLHADTPTSRVDWSSGAVRLVPAPQAWPETGRPRRAAVSSFGASGTNAHVVLEQAAPQPPAPAPEAPVARTLLPVPVSARTPAALRARASALRAVAARDGAVPADIAFSAATGRAAFEHRAVVLAADRGALLDGLDALATGSPARHVVSGEVTRTGRLAMVFPGQGALRLGVGRELHARFDVFADAFDAVLDRMPDGVRDALWGDDPDALAETGVAQPALFAVGVALYRLVESWGVTPDLLAGHSVGELAAAHVAGVLDLDDACTLVSARARLMQALPRGGTMVAVRAGEDEVRAHLTGDPADTVAVAAVNGPESVVLAGPREAVLAVAGRWRHRELVVSHAFHSALMDPVLEEFGAVAASLTWNRPRIPVVTADGTGTGPVHTPAHWVAHVRDTVRFADAAATLAARGARTVLELGPDGSLSSLIGELGTGAASDPVAVPALRRDHDEEESLLGALARLHVRGAAVDWAGVFAGVPARRVDLPTYPFQRERYWSTTAATPAAAARPGPDDGAGDELWDLLSGDHATDELDVDADALAQVLPGLLGWRERRREADALDAVRHRIGWRPVTGRDPVPGEPWLVVGDPAGPDAGLVADLAAATGIEPVWTSVAADADRTEVAGLVAATGAATLHGVLALPGPADPHGGPAAAARVTTLLQGLGDAGVTAPLWVLTRGAVSVAADDPVGDDLGAAAVWGLGRVAAMEYPDRWGGLVDLGPATDARTVRGLAAALTGRDGEDQLAVRPHGLYGRRLLPAPAPRPATTWEPRGTVLVTGGTGALGGHVARDLARAGARRLVLLSRRGPDAPGAAELTAELAGLGAHAEVVAGDAADRDRLAAVLAAIPDEHPLTGVVHASGVLDDGVLDRLTPDRFTEVFHAKVAPALLLDELAGDLDAFVLFSSASSAVGNPGQANYAAANAVLDALAARRRARGAAGTSIAWGAWAGGGMAQGADASEHARRAGLGALDPGRACTVLRQLVAESADNAVVVAVEGPAAPGPRATALLRDMPGADTAAGRGTAPGTPPVDALRERVLALPAAARLDAVLQTVREIAAGVLGRDDASGVGADRPFRDLGFDSLATVEMRNRLSAATGLTLPATLVFDHPTPQALAEHVLAGLTGDPSGTAVPDTGGTAETAVRAALTGLPLERLRDAGLLDALLALAADGTPGHVDPRGDGDGNGHPRGPRQRPRQRPWQQRWQRPHPDRGRRLRNRPRDRLDVRGRPGTGRTRRPVRPVAELMELT
ncbi:SDR family NAD(P)-dependent oxidoreductase [Pseudonocardia sp. EV170527-09]|uniref:type I polyketide synthase n=1 Tax=Pseudonocardia sp. EV170527-09 TaxID=2603411 RepID=UPI0011F3D386|nr:type I polyketide synthase [Pseudonocardia sp. EV170527-09]KAA1013819.1 SDR family NAD(P)-dependent oxidoreductase [Pseudonocardia sp. EV170527-09]